MYAKQQHPTNRITKKITSNCLSQWTVDVLLGYKKSSRVEWPVKCVVEGKMLTEVPIVPTRCDVPVLWWDPGHLPPTPQTFRWLLEWNRYMSRFEIYSESVSFTSCMQIRISSKSNYCITKQYWSLATTATFWSCMFWSDASTRWKTPFFKSGIKSEQCYQWLLI